MNRNILSLVIFVIVLLIAAYALFTILYKPTAYAPPTNTYTSEADLEELNNEDLDRIDSNLEQLDRESSSI